MPEAKAKRLRPAFRGYLSVVEQDPENVEGLQSLSRIAFLLRDWEAALRNFVKIMPQDYKRVLEAARRAEERGEPVIEAIMASAHG